MIQFNPCTNAMIPKTARKSDDKLKYFTPEQSLMFLRSLDKPYETLYKGHYRTDDTGKRYYVDDYTETRDVSTQYKVFYYISLFCGLRKGETLALQWSDIDFEQRIIHVSKSVTKLEDGVAYKDPKTASSNRTVPMPDEVMALLKRYKSEYLQLRLMMGDAWQGENNIFIQSDGKLMGRSTPYQFFKRHLNRYNEWVKNSGEEKVLGRGRFLQMKEKTDKEHAKKPFYKKWWFWVIIIILLAAIIGNNGNQNEDTDGSALPTEQTVADDTMETKADKLPVEAEVVCRALTEMFVENVVGEDYSMLAFNVEDYELDENENGTIKILYMPSNAGNGATKVNLTIVKSDSTYQIEYALLAGVYEVDMSTVSNQYKVLVDQ